MANPKKQNSSHRRLNAEEVATQVRRRGVSIAAGSIRRWAREGRIPFARTVSGRILFDAALVESLIRESAIPRSDAMTD